MTDWFKGVWVGLQAASLASTAAFTVAGMYPLAVGAWVLYLSLRAKP